jgi:hypothetical protein
MFEFFDQVPELQSVHVVRRRCVTEGMEPTVRRKKPGGKTAKRLHGEAEAHLIALTCSEPPAGHEHWTLRVLVQRLVSLGHVPAISYEPVCQRLKKMS